MSTGLGASDLKDVCLTRETGRVGGEGQRVSRAVACAVRCGRIGDLLDGHDWVWVSHPVDTCVSGSSHTRPESAEACFDVAGTPPNDWTDGHPEQPFPPRGPIKEESRGLSTGYPPFAHGPSGAHPSISVNGLWCVYRRMGCVLYIWGTELVVDQWGWFKGGAMGNSNGQRVLSTGWPLS